jgi:hypothetical protein
MAVDLAAHPDLRMDREQITIQEAASAGLKSMEHLIRVLSSQPPPSSSVSSPPHHRQDYTEITDFTVSKFKQVINLLNRTGHARFRRAPNSLPSPQSQPQPRQFNYQPQPLSLEFLKSNPNPDPKISTDLSISQYQKSKDASYSISPPISTTTSSFVSTITGDGSVSDGKIGPAIVAAEKPPLSSSHRKRCHEATISGAGKVSSSGQCHCSKRR